MIALIHLLISLSTLKHGSGTSNFCYISGREWSLKGLQV